MPASMKGRDDDMLRRKTMLNALLLALLAIGFWALQGRANERPEVNVTGGITLNGVLQPLLFTWNSPMPVTGSDWQAGENVSISLHGPLNSPGGAPGDLPLGVLTADSDGELSGVVTIPFDSGISGPTTRIPRPGHYEGRATGAVFGHALA